ncbi:S-adenosyl-L-methionine-dependent methyltransferase [Coniochaeta ligniaria NRRL 30616]|uniref:S-adenosyl-L-methionine-dependent methyltransferase n=1 Tax=Coniochaeta ligniaria NRRL 30616 TaxID=1408157 RepID=A0A1J7IPC7_9PEZI|nr:S-adenosyl-L-methionine-dependent methyltransferase [Coniochaeta ligniaria NRRL 30616]
MVSPNPVQAPPHIHALLTRLHQESTVQEEALGPYLTTTPAAFDALMRDKFIALDEDKCRFTYQLALATGARNIAEVGTSFGVSTIYLALAVGRNVARLGGEGRVIATEKESNKAARARAHWAEAGDELVARWIELREGDLLETLRGDVPLLDMVLIDIWAPVALPALKLLEPRMREGAVVLVDNSISSAERYKELLAHLRSPTGGYTNLTLPYSKGLEMSVWHGAATEG